MDHEHVPSSPIRRQQAAAHDQPSQDRPSTSETQRMMIAGPSDPNHAANVNNTHAHAWTAENDASNWTAPPSSPSLKAFPATASSDWTPPPSDQASHATRSPRSAHSQPSVLDPCVPESSELGPWTTPSTGQWTSTPAMPNPYQWQRPDAVTSTPYNPASSSFCRSPQAPTPTWTANAQPGPSTFKPTQFKTSTPDPIAESTSTLLTSEPLVRVPTDAARASCRLGKRRRAASLPSAIPDVKRTRHHHEHLQPSETWQWRLDRPLPSPTPTPTPQIAKPAVVIIPTPKSQSRLRRAPIVASRKPPINLASLRTLDATELLRNHQLRHDLLFEPLAFRPVSFPNGGPVDYPTIEMYWESIAREIQYGCRCTRWRVAECEDPFQPEILAARKMDTRCVCGGWMLSTGEDKWWAAQKAQWSSRIPPMVETLREILRSLMGSVSVCPDYLVHAIMPETMSVHHGPCPSGTHDTVPGLYAALDPTFVTAQLRRGVLSSAIFKQIGAAMKVHCAPVRDAMVDDMMATAERGDVVTALRKTFDCVEIMKLDIANHKIQAVRPHLWRSTIGYELAQFRATVSIDDKLENSSTKTWLRQASMRVLRAEGAAKRSEILSNRNAYMVRAINEGIMELVCTTKWPSSSTWPPIGPRRRAGRTVTLPAKGVAMPECLCYDAARFENHAQEIRELAFTHLLLSFFREAFEAENPQAGKRALSDALTLAKSEIDTAMDEGRSAFEVRPDSTSDLAFRLAMAAMPPAASRDRPAVACRAHGWAMAFDAYMLPNMRESAIYLSAIKAVREAMTKMLDGRMLALLDTGALADPAPVTTSPTPSTLGTANVDRQGQVRTATDIRLEEEAAMAEWKGKMEAKLEAEGMIAMQTSLVEVTERISKISQYNHGVFKELYMTKGMMIGH